MQNPRRLYTALKRHNWPFRKTLQNSRINKLPEELILLVCYEQTVRGKKWTILWHVDDLKILHVDSDIVYVVFPDIEAEYGKIENDHNLGWDTQMPQDHHKVILARKSNIIYGTLHWKYSWCHLRIHEGRIRNTKRTPPFRYCRICDQTIPNRSRSFSSFCGATTVPVKVITTRYTVASIILMNYNEISWYWWLQEFGRVNEISIKYHWPTIDTVDKKFWKYKVVRWCRIFGAQVHEDPHWWFCFHGKSRDIGKTQKTKTEQQEFNVGWDCRSEQCPDPGDLDLILPEKAGIQDPWQCYLSI